MGKMQKTCSFLGRFFLGAFFIMSAINKIINWEEAQNKFLAALNDWNSYLNKFESLQPIFSSLIPWITTIIIVIIACEFLGGLLLILGIRARLGAFLILIFFIPTTIIFHAFWLSMGIEKTIELSTFLKNIAIMGGLLYVLAFGSK